MDELLSLLSEKIEDAFGLTVADFDIEVDEVIQSADEFKSQGFTDQDIVDTGRLLNSKIVDAQKEADEISVLYSWNPVSPKNGYPYGPAVWAGFYAYGGEKFIPGRHWPERAAKNVGITQSFVDYLRESGIPCTVERNGDDELDD